MGRDERGAPSAEPVRAMSFTSRSPAEHVGPYADSRASLLDDVASHAGTPRSDADTADADGRTRQSIERSLRPHEDFTGPAVDRAVFPVDSSRRHADIA
jgi:hypothetical protein